MSRDVRAQGSFSWETRAEASREELAKLETGPILERSQQALAKECEVLARRPLAEALERHSEVAGPGDGFPPLLTVREAAALLRTTPKAIYHRAERGRLPGLVHDGRRVLVRRQELLRSLTEARVPSPGGPRR